MKLEPRNLMERSQTSKVPISELRLDSENVRLQHLESKSLTEEEIERYFWGEGATNELYAQIKAARGLYQNLIITQNGVVKEGNRRLVCLKRLKQQAHNGKLEGINPNQFDEVKCDVLPRDASEEEIDMLLATIHVRGKKAWDPFNKAKMMAHLNKELNFSYDFISRELGVSKVTLIRMVNAYEATKEYGEIYPEHNWHRHYSYFDELYRRRSLKEWRFNHSNLLQFFSWVHEGKLKTHKDVRSLDKILENTVARRIFDEEGFEKAINFLIFVDPTVQDSDFRSISRAIKTIRSFDRKSIFRIMNDPSRMKMLQNLKSEVTSFLHDIDLLEKGRKKKEDEVLG